ncbi:hypothetical protein OM409_24045, partial [Serratia bockelmannii]
TATVKGALAGKYTLVPEYNGSAIGNLSATVTLTAGVVAKAELSLDKASYVSGGEMTLTATLKDAQGNPVSGQADSLKDAAVPNAVLKGAWTESGVGEYKATFIAQQTGVGLKATLKVADGSVASTTAYAITAGVVAKAELSLDKASYVSDGEMTVTVTLKDAQGNAVSGQADSLKDVKVPNAVLKGAWTETAANSGVYRATYTAKTAGSSLQATLTLNGASATPVTYAITAGVVAKVELSLDKASYVSDGEMTLTVTLKDAQGNAVSGQTDSLKDVKVPNAVLKGTWTETAANAGIYRTTYTAKTAGTGLQATLTLNGASATPVTYAITAGVVAKAELSLDKASYVSGEAMTVTVTLKDAQGNPVSGQADSLKDVAVPNAELKGAWTETAANAGIYRTTYTAETAGSGLQARLTLNGVSASSAVYAITAGTPSIETVRVFPAGNVRINTTLTASYSGFTGNGAGADVSTYQWYWRKIADSRWQKATEHGSVERQFTPDASYAGYEVRVGVTPKGSQKPNPGDEKFSDSVVIFSAPKVEGVSLEGTVTAGSELQVKYTFIHNGTGGDNSLYQWYWYDDNSSTWRSVSGGNTRKWVVPASYAGYRVRVEVIPKGSLGVTGEKGISNESRVLGKLPKPEITWKACWWPTIGKQSLQFTWRTDNIPTKGIRIVVIERDVGEIMGAVASNAGTTPYLYYAFKLGGFVDILFKDEYGYVSDSVTISPKYVTGRGCELDFIP